MRRNCLSRHETKLSLDGRVSRLAEREGCRCLTGSGSRATVLTEAVPPRRRPVRWPGASSRPKVEYSFVDISSREPRDLRRLERAHAGSTGVVVHGWFNRLPGWPSAHGWNAVTAPRRRRLAAEALPCPAGSEVARSRFGAHHIEFVGTHGVLHSEWVELEPGHAVFIVFKPRERMPFRNRVSEAIWTLRPLW